KDIFTPKHSTGRPHKLGPSEIHWAGLLLSRGISQTAVDIQREFFPNVHVDTIRQHIIRIGFRAYKRRRVPYLPAKHRWRQLKWAQALEAWDKNDWARVAFSDEFKYMVFGTCSPTHFWKKRGAKLKPSNVKQVIKFGGGNLMVWGYITRWGVGKLYRIPGTMDTAKYIEILSTAYLGSLPKFGLCSSHLIFQHDNDPKHTACKTKKWLIEHKI
ncbi:transposase, partial [Rhizoctonia solani 123E]